ncbi:hypothetical protein PAPHI01_0923 [Pancytospora philotis]|nr:hypothetical protein PAPHI01_0923 [Pancytospora philotis]
MWAGVLLLLVPVGCERMRGTVAACTLGFPCEDYADFADLDAMKLNGLEGRVADSLYRVCLECDSPEIKRALLEKQLQGIRPDDKARGVVFAMLKQGERSKLYKHLLATGYACRLLLHKLLSGRFMKSLAKEPKASINARPTHQEFSRAVQQYRFESRKISQRLEKKVVVERKKSLSQLAEYSDGLDLAIHAIKTTEGRKIKLLSNAFSQLMGSWSGDAARRNRLLPTVIEFLRILLHPKLHREGAQAKLRQAIVEYVFLNSERKSFELFQVFPNKRTLSKAIQKHIAAQPKNSVSQEFVRHYLAYVESNVVKPCNAAANFFQGLLPPVAAFHAPKTVWNSDPDRFNLISPRWLREMFEDLRDNPAHRARRDVYMRKYIKMLDYDVLVQVLLPLAKDECCKLAGFMLKYRKAESLKQYQKHYKQDENSELTSPQYTNVLGILGVVLFDRRLVRCLAGGRGSPKNKSRAG